MGLKANRSPAGDFTAAQAADAQYREQFRTKNDRISLLSEQLGSQDRTNIRRFGQRSLLAGTGSSTPLAALGGSGGGKSNFLSLFGGLLPGLFGR